jgi:hypothetical protein
VAQRTGWKRQNRLGSFPCVASVRWLHGRKAAEQLITAGITVCSLVIGAVMAGFVSKATNRIQAERIDEQEFSTWLRNRKTEIYSKLLDAARELINQCHWTDPGEDRTVKMVLLVNNVRPTLLRLVAPSPIRELALGVYADCLWLTTALFPETRPQAHVQASLEKVESELIELEDLLRGELEYKPED